MRCMVECISGMLIEVFKLLIFVDPYDPISSLIYPMITHTPSGSCKFAYKKLRGCYRQWPTNNYATLMWLVIKINAILISILSAKPQINKPQGNSYSVSFVKSYTREYILHHQQGGSQQVLQVNLKSS